MEPKWIGYHFTRMKTCVAKTTPTHTHANTKTYEVTQSVSRQRSLQGWLPKISYSLCVARFTASSAACQFHSQLDAPIRVGLQTNEWHLKNSMKILFEINFICSQIIYSCLNMIFFSSPGYVVVVCILCAAPLHFVARVRSLFFFFLIHDYVK